MGRVVVDYEELARMSSVWSEAAATMARLGYRVAALSTSIDLLVDAVFDPGGAMRSERAIIDAAAGPGGLAPMAASLAVDALLLKSVVAKEKLVDDMPIHQLLGVQQWLATLPVTLLVEPRSAIRSGLARFAELGDALPGYVAPFSETLLATIAPSWRFRADVLQHDPLTHDPVFGLPIGSAIALGGRGGGVVTASDAPPTWANEPAPSIEEMLRRVGDLEGAPAASLAVQRVSGSDGVTRAVVYLPGMRHGGFSPDPQDLPGAAAAMVALATAYTRCVTEALDAADLPRGAEVVLVGHSEGGLVAMDLAGDPSFNGGRVQVAQVIAAGSPISSKVAQPGTRVFELDNANDIVTHLDAVESPMTHQTVNRLTYRFARDEHDVVRTHAVDLYADQVRALSGSPNPLYATVIADLGPFFSGTATTAVFTLTDGPVSFRPAGPR
jgi:pimeloyl-ACP methyl ester carboxylesterase